MILHFAGIGVSGDLSAKTGNRSPLAAPSDIFAVQDGWIIVQVIGDPMFRRLARLIGRPDLIEQPCYGNDQARGDNGAALSAVMGEWCARRSRSDALSALEAAKIPCGPVYAPREVLQDAHIQSTGAFTAVDFPGLRQSAPIARRPAGPRRPSFVRPISRASTGWICGW
jgi:crotonobetainyl-CoA:carnitine CoA-transferase CaiB-like acyl-CoA transferase